MGLGFYGSRIREFSYFSSPSDPRTPYPTTPNDIDAVSPSPPPVSEQLLPTLPKEALVDVGSFLRPSRVPQPIGLATAPPCLPDVIPSQPLLEGLQ